MAELLSNRIPVGALATVGAIGAAGFAAFELVNQFHEAQKTVDGIQGTLALMGRSDALPRKDIDAWIKSLREGFNLSESDARAVVEQFAKLNGAAAIYQKETSAYAVASAQATKQPVAKTAEEWAKKYRDAATAVKSLEEETDKLDVGVRHHIDNLLRDGKEKQAYGAVVDQLRQRMENTTGWATQTAAAEEYTKAIAAAMAMSQGLAPPLAMLENAPKQPERVPSSNRGAAATPAIDQVDREIASMMKHAGEQLHNACAILVNEALAAAGLPTSGSNLASSFKNYGQAVAPGDVRRGDIFYSGPSGRGDTGHVGIALGQVVDGRVQVISSHLQGAESNPAGVEMRSAENLSFRRPAGDPAAAAAETIQELEQQHPARQLDFQRQIIEAKTSAEQRFEITKKRVADEIAYQGNSIVAQAEGAKEIAAAEREAKEEALRNTIHKIEMEAVAQRQSDTAQLDAAKKKFAAIAAEHGKGTDLYNGAEMAVAQAEATLRDHAYTVFAEKERAKVEDARGNSTKILAVYDEWLSAIQNTYHRDQREFERVQREKTAAAQRGAAESRQIAEAELSQQARLNDITIRTKKFALDQEVDHHTKTVQEALAAERALTAELGNEDIRRLENFRDTLKELPREQAKIDLELKERKLKLNQDLAQIDKKSADASAKIWRDVNNEIASEASRSLVGMLSGRQSFIQGVEQMGEKYATKALDWAIRETLQWAETEQMKTAITGAASATRAAIDDSSVAGFVGRIGKQLAEWVGLETAKTGETAAATGLRSGIDLAGAALAAKAMIPLAFSEIQISAATAAAAAFADSAMLGPAGLAAAPEVAAGAYGTVMGFATGLGAAGIASGAGGWMVPEDQLMQVHKNEVLLPAKYKGVMDGLAEGGGAGGGGPVVNINVQALDGQSAHRVIMANAPSIVAAFNKGRRLGSKANLLS